MMRLFSEALTCGRFCSPGQSRPVSALCKPERAPGTGGSFRQDEETELAVVTIGYADGLPRDLPQRGSQVLIQGRRGLVGRMCMDQLLVDVSDLSEVTLTIQ